MKDKICCPCCGSDNLFLIKDERPFSVAKAAIMFPFFNVFGILFAFFFGQNGITLSTWLCNDCREKIVNPYEAIESLEKNAKASNVTITVWEIIYTVTCVNIYLSYLFATIGILGVFSLLDSPEALITILVYSIVLTLAVGILLIVGEIIRKLVRDSYTKKIEHHRNVIKSMNKYIVVPQKLQNIP